MIPVADLLPAAARAKPALAALRAELGDPSPDVAQALGIIEGIAADIEAGRHPLDRPDDWPERTRWPQWPHWDRMAWAIKTLAAACGARVQCGQKYEYLDIRLGELRDGAAALHDIAELIELASDREDQARPTGTIDGFFHALDGKAKPETHMSIEDMGEIAAAGWAGALDSSVTITREGKQLIARLSGGRVVRHYDAVALADLLLAAGVSADEVQMPDWREGDGAPSIGERIAIFQRMRKGEL